MISKNLGAVSSTKENNMMKQFKVIIEKHPDGDMAYPVGFKGIIVGEGDTYEEALADVKLAIHFHIETFGQEVLEVESRHQFDFDDICESKANQTKPN